MFNVGDTVLYGSQGVCKIVGTDEKDIGGAEVVYFVLKPIYNPNSTVFVPSSNASLLSKMKAVLTAEEVNDLIREIPTEETIWIDDDGQRKKEYQKIVSEADRNELLRLIKTLYQHEQVQRDKGRRLHQNDEMILHQAEKLLYDEFALVLNIEPTEVHSFIHDRLEDMKKGA